MRSPLSAVLAYRSRSERVALIFMAGFALWCGSARAAEKAPNTDAILRLAGRFSWAHACPLGPREALTNAHVVDLRPFDDIATYPYVWGDAAGNAGFLKPVAGQLERGRDLAWVEPYGPDFPAWYERATEAPKPGDRVWLLGYSWKNRKSVLADDVIEARVTRVVAIHVVFIPSGKPGSSGSCVLNERGQVVAINEGAFTAEDKSDAGLAVGVWGKWARIE